MTYQAAKFQTFLNLVRQRAAREGANYSVLDSFGTYKASAVEGRHPAVDIPAIWIIAQGRKLCYAGDSVYDYRPGKVLVMFYPLAVETEVVEASPAEPFLVAGARIDMARMADVLLRVDRIDGAAPKPAAADPSGVLSLPLGDDLLDPFIRLLELVGSERDALMLGDALVDEVYYRLLTGARSGELRYLLQQRGEIQRISKAVEHIHTNLHEPVSVEELADMVHMSRTSFYENFRSVMHVSPLQYAKSVKLQKARALIQEGRNVGEAGYLVGYNSPAQFSREYKRHFGYAPSATGVATR